MFDYYDTLITPEEVADMLGCGMNTTYKLLKSGKIKAMRIGRVWKIPKRAVQEYIVQEAHMKATDGNTKNSHMDNDSMWVFCCLKIMFDRGMHM